MRGLVLATSLTVLASSLLLVGCGARAPLIKGAADVDVAMATHWELKGKLGVRTDNKGGAATLIWHRHGEQHLIRLYGALGGGRIVIKQDASGAVLKDSKKKTWHGKTARDVLHQSTGWHVPFHEMTRWVLGLPAAHRLHQDQRDTTGRLTTLTQAGWQVRYLKYDEPLRPQLPTRIDLHALPEVTRNLVHKKTGEPIRRMEVRLVVKEWDFAPEA